MSSHYYDASKETIMNRCTRCGFYYSLKLEICPNCNENLINEFALPSVLCRPFPYVPSEEQKEKAWIRDKEYEKEALILFKSLSKEEKARYASWFRSNPSFPVSTLERPGTRLSPIDSPPNEDHERFYIWRSYRGRDIYNDYLTNEREREERNWRW